MSEDPTEARPPRGWLGRGRRALAPSSPSDPDEPEVPEAPTTPQPAPEQPRTIAGAPFRAGFFAALGVLVAIALSQAVLAVQNILVLVLLAFVLALGASPLVNFLDRHMHRMLALALVTIGVLGVVVLGVLAVVPLLTEQGTALFQNLPRMLDNLRDHEQIRNLNERFGIIDRLQSSLKASNIGSQVFNGVLGAGAVVVNFVFSSIITLVLTLYFLASLDRIKQLVYGLAPASQRARAKHIANEIFKGVSGYIQGMVIIVALATVSAFAFLSVAGLGEYAVALSFMHGLLCFIPVVGPPTGAVIITVVAFSINPTAGIASIIFFVVYQQFDAYVIYPNVMKRTVSVPGALVVLSALIGGILLGIIGAVLAIPTAAALIIVWKEIVQPALDAR